MPPLFGWWICRISLSWLCYMYIIILKIGFVNVKITNLGLLLHCTKITWQICAKKKSRPEGQQKGEVMDYMPLDRTERKILNRLRRLNQKEVGLGIQSSKLSAKEKQAAERLWKLNYISHGGLDDDGKVIYGLTELGRRVAIYDKGERYWKTTTFIIPTAISILALIAGFIN